MTQLKDYLFYQDDWATIYCGNCLEIMPLMEPEGVDLVVTDPPYFLPVQHYQTRKKFSRNFSDLGILEHFFKDFFRLINISISQNGTIYMFCDGQSYPLFYYHLYPFCKALRPLIWDKKTSINGYSWRHQHELIIFAEMPEAKPIPSGDGDILRFNAVKVHERKHPAEKPIELLKALISKSTKEGDLILDCFAGSGTTLIASKELDRKFIGIELAREYFNIAQDRLTKQTAGFSPPNLKVLGIRKTRFR